MLIFCFCSIITNKSNMNSVFRSQPHHTFKIFTTKVLKRSRESKWRRRIKWSKINSRQCPCLRLHNHGKYLGVEAVDHPGLLYSSWMTRSDTSIEDTRIWRMPSSRMKIKMCITHTCQKSIRNQRIFFAETVLWVLRVLRAQQMNCTLMSSESRGSKESSERFLIVRICKSRCTLNHRSIINQRICIREASIPWLKMQQEENNLLPKSKKWCGIKPRWIPTKALSTQSQIKFSMTGSAAISMPSLKN